MPNEENSTIKIEEKGVENNKKEPHLDNVNFSLEKITEEVRNIGGMHQFLLNSLESELFNTDKQEYLRNIAKVTLEQLKKDIGKLIIKI